MIKSKKDKNLIENIVDFLLEFLHIEVNNEIKELLIQIFKFGIVGVIATLIDFIFLYIFRDLVGLSLLISNTLSFCISVIYNYIASIIFVFNVNKNKDSKKTFVLFIIFSVIGLGISNVLLEIFTNIFNLYYLISKIISTIVVMTFNFITRKKFLE